jgi:methionyl aminopeptidase
VYTPEEIEGIREACRIGREVLDAGAAAVKAGVTCEEIDRVVHEATVERNAYPSPLNYHQFPKSLCTSVNEVICHGIPDMRELVDGDIVNLDISVYYNGFHADLNETFFVGNVDSEGRKVSRLYNSFL